MTGDRERDQLIALAGVAQAAQLVDQLSHTGSCAPEFVDRSLKSLFIFDSPTVADIYVGIDGVRCGLQTLAAVLASRGEREVRDPARYFFALLHLERRFARDPAMQEVVRSRLQHASFHAEHFTDQRREVARQIAGIYQDTLSQLSFRIRVTGNAQHLENAGNAAMIRALLLAGVRAAFLWRQLGGRRWWLVLARRRMLRRCQALTRSMGVV